MVYRISLSVIKPVEEFRGEISELYHVRWRDGRSEEGAEAILSPTIWSNRV